MLTADNRQPQPGTNPTDQKHWARVRTRQRHNCLVNPEN